MRMWYKRGSWNSICDMCALQYKSDELVKNWKGEMVCSPCYETRHPQDFLRVRGDIEVPPWVRPVGENVFIPICYLWDRSGYVGLGTVGCMLVGNTLLSYDFLNNLKSTSVG